MKRWIVVDGLDGSGKSTVARWIKEHYEARGDRVYVQVHPSDRRAGRMSRRALQERGPIMFVISTAFYVLDVLISVAKIRTEYEKYDDLVFVRYLMGTAYLPKRFARQGYDVFAKVLPVPERLLLVDIDPEKALHRIAQRDDREEMFENLPALNKGREKILMLSEGWRVLNNNGDEASTRQLLNEQLESWDRVLGPASEGSGTGPASTEGGLTSG
ncbi:MAG: thymidylate kinase [Methanomassiliicoccus sp.]|nr:thymidylate kinase [Methanomassiliicoccus sp.]